MQYIDKSVGRAVSLKNSSTQFLVITAPSDEESLRPLLRQRLFTVRPSTNNDGIFVLAVKSEAESPVAINKVISELQGDPHIKEVVPALIDEQGKTRFALPNRVVAQFSGVSDRAVSSFLRSVGSAVVQPFRTAGLFEITVPNDMEIGDFIDTLNANAQVEFAEPSFYGVNDADFLFSVTASTSIPASGNDGSDNGELPPADSALSWNLERIRLRQAWQRTRGRSDVVVAVLDGMPDVAHEALTDKQATQMSDDQIFTPQRSLSSHATNICTIIAGESASFIGVAPGVRILPLVINLDSQRYAERADAIDFAARCAQQGRIGQTRIRRLVLSCSWRTSGDVAVVRNALRRAVAAGVVVVFSAGNDGTDEVHYPSSYGGSAGSLANGLIAVAATAQNDEKAEYSNYGRSVDLSAPGGDGLPIDERDVPCGEQGNLYGFAAGTSIAVPHVSAVAALMLSVAPELNPAELKRLLKAAADSIARENPDYPNMLGTGRLNAERALAAVAARTGNSQDESVDMPTSGGAARLAKSGPRITIEIRGR